MVVVVGRCGGSWPCIGSRCGEALAGTAYCPCATWCWLDACPCQCPGVLTEAEPSGVWSCACKASVRWHACHRYMAVSLPDALGYKSCRPKLSRYMPVPILLWTMGPILLWGTMGANPPLVTMGGLAALNWVISCSRV